MITASSFVNSSKRRFLVAYIPVLAFGLAGWTRNRRGVSDAWLFMPSNSRLATGGHGGTHEDRAFFARFRALWDRRAGDGAEAPERLPPEGGTPPRRALPVGVPASGNVVLLAHLHSF